MHNTTRASQLVAAVVLAASPPANAAGPAEAAFIQCAACHQAEKGAAHGVGPNLFGVFGREKAAAPDYVFSRTLRKQGGVWTEAELHRWLENPQAYAPGTKMAYGGLKDQAARQAVIDFLKTLR